MAKSAARASKAKAAAPEFPKKLVRVRLGVGNQPETDVVTVENAEAESSMAEQGYKPFDDVLSEPPVQEYPKWLYSPTEGRRIINSADEEDKLSGDWSDSPAGHEQVLPVNTDLTRAKATLGDDLAAKLDRVANQQLGLPEAAPRADGNFDPANVPIAKGENPDAKVMASKSADAAKGTK